VAGDGAGRIHRGGGSTWSVRRRAARDGCAADRGRHRGDQHVVHCGHGRAVSGKDPLSCLTAADCALTRGSRPRRFGGPVVSEGTSAVGSNTTAVVRNATLADTDNNVTDFRGGHADAGEQQGQTHRRRSDDPVSLAPPNPTSRHHEISRWTAAGHQRARHRHRVRNFGNSKGFFFRTRRGQRPRTSEGMFAYTGSRRSRQAGDSVLVSGRCTSLPDETGQVGPIQSITGAERDEGHRRVLGQPVARGRVIARHRATTSRRPAPNESLTLQPRSTRWTTSPVRVGAGRRCTSRRPRTSTTSCSDTKPNQTRASAAARLPR